MWSLFEDKKGVIKELVPKKFSNGKSQEDIVNEVVAEIKKGRKVIFVHGVCGSGKCLSKDTRVFCKPQKNTGFSYFPISELVGKQGKVISLNYKGNLVESSFNNVINSGRKKLYLLRTRTGRQIKVSANHPFLTITRKGLEWLPLSELKPTSYICLPNFLNLQKFENLDKNIIKILAHLIAEGKLGDKNGSPKYYQNPFTDLEVRLDYEDALTKLFPEGQLRSSSPCEVTMVFNNRDTRFGTTNKLRLLVREFGLDGGKSGDKFVPPIIFNLSDVDVALFLRTLFSGDGTIYAKKSHNRNKMIIIEYCSISKKLIQDVSLLLMRFGIQHTITSKKFRDKKDYSWNIHISSQRQIKKFIENIGFVGRKQRFAESIIGGLKDHKFSNIDKVPRVIREYLKDKGFSYNQLNRFLNYKDIKNFEGKIGFKKMLSLGLAKCSLLFREQKIDFLREHIRKINENIHDASLSFICEEDIFWDKIDSTVFIGEEETYDLEVQDYHNFIADGIIVHNSAIALNIARELGRASIVVPIKNLQRQYEKDYMQEKFVLKSNNQKLKISMITGRANHKCTYLQENKKDILLTRMHEKDANLFNIFESMRKNRSSQIEKDESCDNFVLPCKIEIKQKNINTLKKYYKENPEAKNNKELDIKLLRRLAVAPACPYWSPILREDSKIKLSGEKKKYHSIVGEQILYVRKEGCPYYQQFNSYIDSDVIIFNSDHYLLETALGRKPATDVEIIDECDEFLDSFSTEGSMNLDKLRNELVLLDSNDEKEKDVINGFIDDINGIQVEAKKHLENQDIMEIKDTHVGELLKSIMNNDLFYDNRDDEGYMEHCFQVARDFHSILEDVYVSFTRDKVGNTYVKLVTVNLEKMLGAIIEKNKAFVFMSGTIHDEIVLKEIFGLKDFKIIDAEIMNQGTITKQRTNFERDFSYDGFKTGRVNREQYLVALNKCVAVAKKPVVVHVNAFQDMPDAEEIEKYGLRDLVSRQNLIETQNQDKEGRIVMEFKSGKSDVLFTTRCNRGIDFPFETCNSVVITKFPYPNTQGLFWRILKKNKPTFFWDFYKDKAHRELLQRIYRSVRAVEDHVFLLSPDLRVLETDVV